MGRLDGKVAIVTGASRGIGAKIARRFGADGAAVAVVARTAEPGTSQFAGTIDETAADVIAVGVKAVAITANLASQDHRERLAAETALTLCHRDPPTLTGRITYSQELLTELGVPVPQA